MDDKKLAKGLVDTVVQLATEKPNTSMMEMVETMDYAFIEARGVTMTAKERHDFIAKVMMRATVKLLQSNP